MIEQNLAERLFLDEKALNFQNWYHPEICHYLLQMADNEAKCIRVIFHDADEGNNTKTFKKQLLQLVMLSNWLKRPALFVSKEPGADNHFICGLVKEGNLLLINPLGITRHKTCYQTLAKLKREKTIKEVWLSSNSLQKRQYEEEGLVSCGPIALELAVHILTNFTPERLDSFWVEHLKTDGYTTHDASGLTYYGINIQSLLPNTLKELTKATDESHYQSQVCAIRKKHCEQLQALPVERAENLHTSVEIYLSSCKEGGPHQLIFNALIMGKTLNDIDELPAYQLLKQELNTQITNLRIDKIISEAQPKARENKENFISSLKAQYTESKMNGLAMNESEELELEIAIALSLSDQETLSHGQQFSFSKNKTMHEESGKKLITTDMGKGNIDEYLNDAVSQKEKDHLGSFSVPISPFQALLNKIEGQINTKLSDDTELQKWLSELKENAGLLESLQYDQEMQEGLPDIVTEGKAILSQINQRVSERNRNIAALLKASFRQMNEYYDSFLNPNLATVFMTEKPGGFPEQDLLSKTNAAQDFSIAPVVNENKNVLLPKNAVIAEKDSKSDKIDSQIFSKSLKQKESEKLPVMIEETFKTPQGINCQYVYSPTIKQTQLVIEVNNPNLSPDWKSLILKLAEIHKGEAFSLTDNQEILFNRLLRDAPLPQSDIYIDAKPLLDQRNVVIKLIEKTEGLQGNIQPKSDVYSIIELLDSHYRATEYQYLYRISGYKMEIQFCHINLSMIKSDIQSKNKIKTLEIENIFSDKKNQHDFKSKYSPTRVLITGNPGVGKTSLCKKIIHDYMGEKDTSQKKYKLGNGLWKKIFKWIIYIPLRNIKNYPKEKRPYNLGDIIYFEFFQNHPTGREFSEQLWKILVDNKNETLFLLDGWDEISQEYEDENIQKILTYLLNQPYLILTSRPYTKFNIKFNLELEMPGFNQKNIKDYLETIMPEELSLKKDIESFIERNVSVSGLTNIPICLDILCDSWELLKRRKQSRGTISITELFQIMVDKLWLNYFHIKEVKDRLQENKKFKGWLKLPDDLLTNQISEMVNPEEEYLKLLAYNGIKNNIAIFDHSHLKKILAKYYQSNSSSINPLSEIKKSNFITITDLHLNENIRDYCFIHLMFQEFFIAKYLFDLSLSEDEELYDKFVNIVSKNIYNPRYTLIWIFLSGMLKNKREINIFYEKLFLINEPSGIHQVLLIIKTLEENKISKRLNIKYRERSIALIKSWMTLKSLCHIKHELVKSHFVCENIQMVESLLTMLKQENSEENIKLITGYLSEFSNSDNSDDIANRLFKFLKIHNMAHEHILNTLSNLNFQIDESYLSKFMWVLNDAIRENKEFSNLCASGGGNLILRYLKQLANKNTLIVFNFMLKLLIDSNGNVSEEFINSLQEIAIYDPNKTLPIFINNLCEIINIYSCAISSAKKKELFSPVELITTIINTGELEKEFIYTFRSSDNLTHPGYLILGFFKLRDSILKIAQSNLSTTYKVLFNFLKKTNAFKISIFILIVLNDLKLKVLLKKEDVEILLKKINDNDLMSKKLIINLLSKVSPQCHDLLIPNLYNAFVSSEEPIIQELLVRVLDKFNFKFEFKEKTEILIEQLSNNNWQNKVIAAEKLILTNHNYELLNVLFEIIENGDIRSKLSGIKLIKKIRKLDNINPATIFGLLEKLLKDEKSDVRVKAIKYLINNFINFDTYKLKFISIFFNSLDEELGINFLEDIVIYLERVILLLNKEENENEISIVANYGINGDPLQRVIAKNCLFIIDRFDVKNYINFMLDILKDRKSYSNIVVSFVVTKLKNVSDYFDYESFLVLFSLLKESAENDMDYFAIFSILKKLNLEKLISSNAFILREIMHIKYGFSLIVENISLVYLFENLYKINANPVVLISKILWKKIPICFVDDALYIYESNDEYFCKLDSDDSIKYLESNLIIYNPNYKFSDTNDSNITLEVLELLDREKVSMDVQDILLNPKGLQTFNSAFIAGAPIKVYSTSDFSESFAGSVEPHNIHFSREFFTNIGNEFYSKFVALLKRYENIKKRYQLSDFSQESLEKGLRNATCKHDYENIELLIHTIKNINAKDNGINKRTALHWSIIKNSVRAMSLLLQAGSDLNICDAYEKMPLDYTDEKQYNNIIRILEGQTMDFFPNLCSHLTFQIFKYILEFVLKNDNEIQNHYKKTLPSVNRAWCMFFRQYEAVYIKSPYKKVGNTECPRGYNL